MAERFFQLRKQWLRTGVCPRGAHVCRIEGRSEKPVSSTKTIVAQSRAAFFIAGHVGRIQRPIASSSRSRARVIGF